LFEGCHLKTDLISLRLFVAVAEELSLTRAAAREHLVLGAVSKRIKELESSVGTQLLCRHARGVTLTSAGHTLLRHARQISHTLAHIRSDMAEQGRGINGYVRMKVSTAALTQHLPEELSRFLSSHPQIMLDLTEGSSHSVIQAIAEGHVDLGIVEGRALLRNLASLPYHRDRLVAVVPASHALARRKGLKFSEVLDYDLVGTRGTSSLHGLLARASIEAGVSLKLRIQLRGFDAICRMIQANLGIGILPERSVCHLFPAMNLRAIPLTEAWAERTYRICFRALRGLPQPARALAEHLKVT
jgi:DNA-binding transcriptional LysR family regulator